MSSNRAPIDELLATADPAGTLGPVVRAATAPAHAEELAGEGAALAAFRATATAPRPSRLRAVATRLLTVKAVIAVTVAGSAGIVLAATGSLPSPWSEPDPPPPPPSVSVPAPTASVPGHESTHSTEPTGATGPSESTQDQPESEKSAPPRGRDEPPGREKKQGEDSADDPGHDEGKKPHPNEDDGDEGEDDQDEDPRRSPAPDPGGGPDRPGHGRPQVPGSPARGAAPTVPPSGATPPSQGG